MKISLQTVLLIIVILEGHASNVFNHYFKNISETVVSEKCRKQLDKFSSNPELLWKMFDASSKYPINGLSYSNNRDLGNYDECMSIEYEDIDGRIIGKFCGYSVAVINPLIPGIADPYPVLTEEEPTAPPYTLTLLSTCIPEACTPKEVGKYFITSIEDLPIIQFPETLPCVTKETNTKLEWYDILFIAFLALILLSVILSTGFDYVTQDKDPEVRRPLFLSFSLITNAQKLFKISHTKNKEQIQCFNGMRFISMIWIIAGHNWNAVEYLPIVNYAEVHDWVHNVRIQYIASAPIAVDTFFFMSGFLLAYGYLKAAAKIPPVKQLLGVPMMVLHRYLRLTPAVAALFFVQVTIYRFLGSGPMWEQLQKDQSQRCKDMWWPFFLYIQNYYDWQNMCLQWTWYLSADMQMFILASLLMIPVTIFVKNKQTVLVLILLAILSCICVVIPIAYRFIDLKYTNDVDTHARLCDYAIGILMGVLFKEYLRDRPFLFSKIVNILIWIVVLVIDVGFNMYFNYVINHYTRTSQTLFYGLYKPIWCLSVAWMLYSCYHGYGGIINWILTLPFFQIGARLSYCMYLLHFSVIMYYTAMYRTDYYWGDYNTFNLWCGHLIVTMILSTIWTLAFESPMIVLERLIFGGTKKPTPKKEIQQQS